MAAKMAFLYIADAWFLISAVLGCLFYAAWLTVYRLYLHPLSKFPGPKLAAISDYWELHQDFFREESGHLFHELENLHKKYGPIVRIRPNEVHVKDSTWMDVLYPGSSERRDRDPLVGTAIGTPLATIGTGPHDLHRVRKGAISAFFSSRSVQAMEPVLQQHTADFREDLKRHLDETLDLRVYFFAWTTDFVTGQIFHKRAGLFWNPQQAQDWFDVMFDFSGIFPLTKHFPWLVTMGLALPVSLYEAVFPALAPFIAVYKDLLVMAHKAFAKYSKDPGEYRADQNPDIFNTLLSSNLPLEEKKPKRIANEVYNLLVAGSLTTSKTATVGVFHILSNPGVHRKLRKELIAAIPDPQSIPSVKTLQQLPYLVAVIKETMRIGCIVTTRFPMISPDNDLQHGESIIPAGSSVSMTFCRASIDPEIFPDPQTFRPERWLSDEQGPHDYERYVLPFGRGARVCVGIHLSYAQLYLLLACTFRCFDMELVDTTRERDIDIKGGGPLGEPTRKTKGVRMRVTSILA